MSEFNWDVDTWKTLDSYFKQDKILIQHQIDSFNNFVDYTIAQLIERNNPITIASGYKETNNYFDNVVTINLGQIYTSKPVIHENTDVIKPLTPNEARLRGLTYSAPVCIDVKITKKLGGNTEEKTLNKIPFIRLPIMLHSKYCHLSDRSESSLIEMGECEFDWGGYFIVNGGEKVLVSQERIAENQIYVFRQPKGSISKWTHEAEIKAFIRSAVLSS